MFGGGLAEAIDELDIPTDPRALARAVALLDRLAAKVCAAVGSFDRAGLWDVDGATSMRAWLKDAGLTAGDASRLTVTGQRVHALPEVRDAWERGELSGGQVQAIVRNLAERHVELFAEHSADVVPALVGLNVADTARVMNEWSAKADALDDQSEPDEPPCAFHLSATLDGRWVADGTFDAESGALVAKAIELAQSKDYTVPAAQRRADALVDIAAYFLDNQAEHTGGRHRPHLNVIVERERGELVETGHWLKPATLARLACDSVIHRITVDRPAQGRMNILDVAAATRTITAALWTALVIRDRHCRFPGCDRPPSWCEGHHVQWVSNNGPTRLENLVLLCRRHHRLLHTRPGYVAKLEPDGPLTITQPDGRQRTTHPPPAVALELLARA